MSRARLTVAVSASFLILGPASAAPMDPKLAPVTLSTSAPSRQAAPGASLARSASTALEAGQYQDAVKLAAEALKAEPGNQEAATVLHFAAGRGAASGGASVASASKEIEPKTTMALPSAISADRQIVMTKVEKRPSLAVPDVATLNILDDETAAPEPSAVDRILALFVPSKRLVGEDLKVLKTHVADFDVPAESMSLGSGNFEAPRQFVSWIKTARDGDLPDISYDALPAGQLASYHQGILGRHRPGCCGKLKSVTSG